MVKLEINQDDRCLPFVLDLKSDVIYITIENLYELERILSDAYILGIDTETRPSFYNRHTRFWRYPTSIIQIAARTRSDQEFVAIVDLLNFSTNEESLAALDNVLIKVMSSVDVVKMGQGLENDLKEIVMFYPTLAAFKDVPSIVDTNVLYRFLHPEVKQDTSLKNLTLTFLHCNLVKTQQCSDWGKRPLLQAQKDYAARDALVLLRLFDAMCCEAMEKEGFDLLLLQRRFQDGVNNKIVAASLNVFTASTAVAVIIPEMGPSIHTRFDEINMQAEVQTAVFTDKDFPDLTSRVTSEVVSRIASTDEIPDTIFQITHSTSSVSLSSEASKSSTVSSASVKKTPVSHRGRKVAPKQNKPRKKEIWKPLHTVMSKDSIEFFPRLN